MTMFERARSGEVNCPSDLALDRLFADESSTDEREGLTTHLAGCASCTSRMRERAAGFELFPRLDAARVLARVEAAREEPSQSWLGRLRALFTGGSGALATGSVLALAIVLLAVLRDDARHTDAHGMLRAKGGLALHVHRQRGSHSELVLSGERFAPGDRLRFVIDTPAPGYVTIVGVEADGDIYTAWPREGRALELPASKDRVLDGAVALDDAPGRESLYLVYCPSDVGPPSCVSRGPVDAPDCSRACSLAGFTLEKQR